MKTRMPFGGFFLELLDEQNGTCEYEEYQRKCEEEPLTEEEQKEQAEQAKALTDLNKKASGNTVTPGASTPARPQFKNFRDAAEYYSKHPEEAAAMANRECHCICRPDRSASHDMGSGYYHLRHALCL